jgi:tRNA 2-selenouridine synthase SelU
MDFEKAKELCINGEMTTVDAAYECGMSRSAFYKLIWYDKEAYPIFLSNTAKRGNLKSQHVNREQMTKKYMARAEVEEENKFKAIMRKYHSKTLEAKAQVARQLGISYGKFMALARELGRLKTDEA